MLQSNSWHSACSLSTLHAQMFMQQNLFSSSAEGNSDSDIMRLNKSVVDFHKKLCLQLRCSYGSYDTHFTLICEVCVVQWELSNSSHKTQQSLVLTCESALRTLILWVEMNRSTSVRVWASPSGLCRKIQTEELVASCPSTVQDLLTKLECSDSRLPE